MTEVGLLEVLREPGVPLLVPDAVLAEIGYRDPNDPAALAVQQAPWIQVVPTPRIPDAVLAWDLDAGESAVLAVALEQSEPMVILDDQAARRCARVLGLASQGTLGLVLAAKRQGLIPAVRPVLDHLRRAGMYMTDRLANEILDAAGEMTP